MESIKQEIINNIYENGEQLITGPILQGVLLDMVDDVNDKVASASAAIPGDLVEKTGSWDDAADWVEQNSSSVVLQPDLDGYATEQWVEDQGYLKEVPEGYATTESLNDLSESVAQSIADIPEPDLSNYVTKPELNEATESVKEWVESKHYLTTASLSGSVTEETVGFMINDATASVKDWVESKSYATEQWVEEQGYLKEHQDISGLATTESVNQLSESIAQTIEDLPQVDLNGYVTTASYNADSASFDERINAITGSDLSGYATTASVNQLSESIAQELETKVDEEGVYNILAGTGLAEPEYGEWTVYEAAKKDELLETSSSLSASIAAISASGGVDLSGYVTTSSFEDLEGRVDILEEDVAYLANAKDALEGAEIITWDDENEEWTAVPLATSESVNSLSESVAQDFANLDIPDISGLASTSSLNSLSESVAGDVADLSASIAAISGSDLSGYVTTASYNADSASFDQRINSITGSGSPVDLSGYATTASLISTTDPSNSAALFLETLKEAQWDEDRGWVIPGVAYDGEGDFGETAPAILKYFAEFGIVSIEQEYDEVTGDPSHWMIQFNIGNVEWEHNPVMGVLNYAASGSGPGKNLVEWEQLSENDGVWYSPIVRDFYGYEGNPGVSASFVELSESVASMPGADPTWIRGEGSGSAVLKGSNSNATGKSSVAQGYKTTASGIYSHAEGQLTIAEGSASHAEGLYTSASGDYSHAEGRNTIAINNNEHAEGKYNATASSQIFSVGVGRSNTDRKNAVSIITGSDPSASIYLYGVGSYDGTNPQPGVNDVATLINAGGGSGVDTDLRSFLFGVESQTLTGITGSVTNIYSDISSDTTLGFNAVPGSGKSLGITIHNTGNNSVNVTLPATVAVGGTTYNLINNGVDNSGSMSIPSGEYGDIVVTRNGNNLFVRTSIDVSSISGSSAPVDLSGYATTASLNELSESVAGEIEGVNGNLSGIYHDMDSANPDSTIYSNLQPLMQWVEDPSDPEQGMWTPVDFVTTASFENTSASFDSRINSIITGSGVDLSGYATTESVNNLSSSVGDISSSFAETIANIPTGSGGSGNYLPLTGGTLTGNLKVDASVGIGVNPGGSNCLAVGGSGTETSNAHNSVAIGEDCHVSIWNGFAAGRETVVEGDGAFGMATGFRNRTTKMAGYAGGCLSTASGEFATAIGFGAEAAAKGQVVLGAFNVVDSSNGTGSYAVILGNGKSSTWNQDDPGDITRSNGLAIKWDGGIDINYSGSTITLQDKIAELEQGGGSPVDLSGYATTESVNILSASFDQRINNITASAGVDIVTVLTSGSTDSQVPSAKCVYDLIGEIESALIALR